MSLDDDIRKALTALEGTVPEGYFEKLPGRIEQRLEAHVMEADMTSDGKNGDQGQVPGEAPPSKKKEENTGLHDIKAMAQSAKRRVSRRITTQSESEEQLLLSASNSMNQVVLPDPNKEVAVDVAPAVSAHSETQERAARGGIPIWVYGAVAVVAAAAVVFFVIRGRKADDDQGSATRVATGESTPAGERDRSPGPTGGVPAPSAEPLEGASGAKATTDDTATAEPIMADPADPAAGGDGDSAADAPGGAAPSNGGAAGRPERKDRETKPDDERARPPKDAVKDPAKPPAPKADAVPPPPPKKPPADGKRSLDDLLDEAAGGPVPADKDTPKPAGPDTTAPAKTDISRDEISSGMSRVLGRVQGCYDTHKESGTVMIAVTIDPAGTISSASATGKFGGTPTGACVAEAVKKARFAAWEGKPKKINYPFLLSP